MHHVYIYVFGALESVCDRYCFSNICVCIRMCVSIYIHIYIYTRTHTFLGVEGHGPEPFKARCRDGGHGEVDSRA